MSSPGHVAVELPPTAVARQNSPDPDALAVIQYKPSVYKAGMRVVLQVRFTLVGLADIGRPAAE